MARILFVSTMEGPPWGGSEELWARTALRLAAQGHEVGASIRYRSPRAPQIDKLALAGIRLFERGRVTRMGLVRQRLGLRIDAAPQCLDWFRPDLVVLSDGRNRYDIPWMSACVERAIPFAYIAQAAMETAWFPDCDVAGVRPLIEAAVGLYFVSHANMELTRRQYAMALPAAKVVRNPFNVSHDVALPWPRDDGTYRMACVARLEPGAKGQDVLFEVLSIPKWRERPLRVSLLGDGAQAEVIGALRGLMGLGNVELLGFRSSIEDVWQAHHALVLPSRFEGLPIAMVEAMLCARPCIVTSVSGNPELLEDNVTGFLAAAPTAPLLDEAMERAWRRRSEWEQMGRAAAVRVRQSVPPDPVGVFADEVLSLLGTPPGKSW